MSFSETILFKLNVDAASMDKGMNDAERKMKTRIYNMVGIRTKAEQEYQTVWRKAEMERDRISAANHSKQVSRWKEELAAQRKIATEKKYNVAQGSGGVHGGSGGIVSEIGVMGREAMAGRWSNLSRSAGVLAQRTGLLGKALEALASPVGMATASVLGLGLVTKSYIESTISTMREARMAGFTMGGYQDVTQRGAFFGEGDAVKGGIGNLTGMIGGARSGDLGAVQSFKNRGIDIAGKNTDEIYAAVMARVNSETNTGRRQRMGEEFFGSSFSGMQRTAGIEESWKGIRADAADSLVAQTVGESAGNTAGGVWSFIKDIPKAIGSVAGGAFDFLSTGGKLNKEAARGQGLDAALADFNERHEYNPRKIENVNPKLAQDLKLAKMQQEDVTNSREDYAGGKVDLSTMADEARRMTGQIHRRNYTVTPRMRTALNIQDLEEQSRVAFEQGNDSKAQALMKQATDMRASNPWMKSMDRNPMRKSEEELINVNKHLELIQTAVKNALKDY